MRRLISGGLGLILGLILLFAQIPSAAAARGNSAAEADMTIAVECFSVEGTSSKDVSNVKVYFADGTRQEIDGLSGHEFSRTFSKEIDYATAKSGITQVQGEADGCSGGQPPASQPNPGPGNGPPPATGQPGNGSAEMTIEVECFSIEVTSSKDISNVKVYFTDGTRQEIDGLSGHEFSRTLSKAIDYATAKSGITQVRDDAPQNCSSAGPPPTPPAPPIPHTTQINPPITTPPAAHPSPPAVLGVTFTRATTQVQTSPKPTAVLGVRLARTGMNLPLLATLAALLIGAGYMMASSNPRQILARAMTSVSFRRQDRV